MPRSAFSLSYCLFVFVVEEDTDVENIVGATSPKKDKETLLPPMVSRKCLEAHYSGTSSLPLLTNSSPMACSVVKHNAVSMDSERESVTTLDPPTNVTTPSDIHSMTIVPYESSSPGSWCSLHSVATSPTHNKSGNATPTVISDNTTANHGSCDASPTHNNLQKEQCKYTTWQGSMCNLVTRSVASNSPLLTGKVEQLTELVEKMSAKILLLETRLQLMEGNTQQQQEPVTMNSETIAPSPSEGE